MALKSQTSGRVEIEAAKQRLAVAKKWESSTADALRAAEEQANDARSRLETARDEAREAEARLRDVERRWEVVDVDDDGDSPVDAEVDSPSPREAKKRKTAETTERRATKGPRSVSPVSEVFVFDVCAPPGRLGLTFDIQKSSTGGIEIAVTGIRRDSSIFGMVQKGDMVVEFNGVNTENMSAFTEHARKTLSTGNRKFTFRRGSAE